MQKAKGYFMFIILNIFSIIIFIMGLLIIFKSFSFAPAKNIKELNVEKDINYKIETKDENKELEEDKDIVASTISKIKPKFSVTIKTKNKQNIKYKYKINAILNATSNKKLVQTKKYKLVPKKEIRLEQVNKETVTEDLILNYEDYIKDNEDIKTESGELVSSTLIVNMTIEGETKQETFSEFLKLKIPVTNQNKKIKIIKNYSKKSKSIAPKYVFKIKKYNYLLGGIIILIGSLTLFITSIIYIKRIKEIKKIRKRITKLKTRR